jgi:GNAT superfamily N-acetyltransferase
VSDYLSQTPADHHQIEAFSCGKESLDTWLRNQARRAQAAGTARTYVWTRPNQPDVLAYFSIAPTQVVRAEVPSSLTDGYTVIPAYLLARLALDQTLHGQGLGSELLLDALTRIVEAARTASGRLIVVDAIDDQAHAFHRRHDFIPLKDSQRLYLKIATAEEALTKTCRLSATNQRSAATAWTLSKASTKDARSARRSSSCSRRSWKSFTDRALNDLPTGS